MMFKHRFHEAIVAGEITRTYRRWKQPRVVAGRYYKLANHGYIEVQSISVARRLTLAGTGFSSTTEAKALMGDVGTLYQVVFRFVGERPDLEVDSVTPRSDDAMAEMHAKLRAKDRASRRGSWTMPLLRAIAAAPGTSSAVLSFDLGVDQKVLKQDVRKLKALGLTISLETGYRLSPVGEAYVRFASLND